MQAHGYKDLSGLSFTATVGSAEQRMPLRDLFRDLPGDLQRRIQKHVIKTMGIDGRLLFGIRPGKLRHNPNFKYRPPRFHRHDYTALNIPNADLERDCNLDRDPYYVSWSQWKVDYPRYHPFRYGQCVEVYSISLERTIFRETCSSVHGWLDTLATDGSILKSVLV